MANNEAPPSKAIAQKITCEECVYWVMKSETRGRCHRKAPTASSDLRYKELIQCCPMTRNTFWCGEVKKK